MTLTGKSYSFVPINLPTCSLVIVFNLTNVSCLEASVHKFPLESDHKLSNHTLNNLFFIWNCMRLLSVKWLDRVKTHSAAEPGFSRQLFWVLWLTWSFLFHIGSKKELGSLNLEYVDMRGNGMSGVQDMAAQENELMASLLGCSTPGLHQSREAAAIPGNAECGEGSAPMETSSSGVSQPSLSLETPEFLLEPEFQMVPRCPWGSTLLHPKPSSSGDQQWKEKLGIETMGSWNWGGSRSDCRLCSSKTFFQDHLSSHSLKLSQLKPLKAGAGGFEVTTCSSCCPKCCISEFAFVSVIVSTEAAFALRFSLAVCTKHK